MIFEKTLNKTNQWLQLIAREIGSDDERAYLALRTVLHAVRDHLPVNEAIQLGAELPMLVRGFYFEGWNPGIRPIREKKKSEFIHDYFKNYFPDESDNEIEGMIRGVLQVVAHKISEGESNDVRSSLPHYMRELWPAAA